MEVAELQIDLAMISFSDVTPYPTLAEEEECDKGNSHISAIV